MRDLKFTTAIFVTFTNSYLTSEVDGSVESGISAVKVQLTKKSDHLC